MNDSTALKGNAHYVAILQNLPLSWWALLVTQNDLSEQCNTESVSEMFVLWALSIQVSWGRIQNTTKLE